MNTEDGNVGSTTGPDPLGYGYIPAVRQFLVPSPYSQRRREEDIWERNGDMKPPRMTALCYGGQHGMCRGGCTPPPERYAPDEPFDWSGVIACECACHPVVVAP